MIYLDYAATHPPDVGALEQALAITGREYANPSGRSIFSQQSKKLLEECREQLSALLCPGGSLLFTSNASEANAIALWCMYGAVSRNKKNVTILTSPLEHPSLVETLKKLPKASLAYLPVDRWGVSTESAVQAIRDYSPDIFICISAHNETGLFADIPAILGALPAEMQKSLFILTDIAQYLPKAFRGPDNLPGNLQSFDTLKDYRLLMSAAGHKVGAGHGCGLLFSPQKELFTQFENLSPFAGGSQEYGIRPGTQNLCAIYALRTVLQKRLRDSDGIQKLREVTQSFEKKLHDSLDRSHIGFQILGEAGIRLPGVSMICLPNAQIDFLLMGLDSADIICSTGTSCKSGSRTASPGLLAMGYSENEALSVIRFSYGLDFTPDKQEIVIRTLLKLLPSVKK